MEIVFKRYVLDRLSFALTTRSSVWINVCTYKISCDLCNTTVRATSFGFFCKECESQLFPRCNKWIAIIRCVNLIAIDFGPARLQAPPQYAELITCDYCRRVVQPTQDTYLFNVGLVYDQPSTVTCAHCANMLCARRKPHIKYLLIQHLYMLPEIITAIIDWLVEVYLRWQ